LTVNVDPSPPIFGQNVVRRRLSKRPSLDSGINLAKTNESGFGQQHQIESEPRKPLRLFLS
jgi:hypothetical protein